MALLQFLLHSLKMAFRIWAFRICHFNEISNLFVKLKLSMNSDALQQNDAVTSSALLQWAASLPAIKLNDERSLHPKVTTKTSISLNTCKKVLDRTDGVQWRQFAGLDNRDC